MAENHYHEKEEITNDLKYDSKGEAAIIKHEIERNEHAAEMNKLCFTLKWFVGVQEKMKIVQ